MTDSLFDTISKLWFRLHRKSKLKRYEVVCLDSMKEKISKESQKKLASQLIKFNLIQRQAYGLKSVFYDTKDPKYLTWMSKDLFINKAQNLKVFSGLLMGHREDIQAQIKFEIFIHRGRLSSIEFESTPTLMEKLDRLEVKNTKIVIAL